MKNSSVIYLERRWPCSVFIGYCPDEIAWDKEMLRLEVVGSDDDRKFPSNHGSVTWFEGEAGVTLLVQVKTPKTVSSEAAIGLIAHEATHCMQHLRKYMNETQPGWEWEAYTVQFITQELTHLIGKHQWAGNKRRQIKKDN